MAILEEVAWLLQICNNCFYQVNELWPIRLLFDDPLPRLFAIMMHQKTWPLCGRAYFPYIYRNFEDQIKKMRALLGIYSIATPFYRAIVSLLNIEFIQKS